MKDALKFLKLTLVTNRTNISTHQYLNFVYACAKSGLTSIQLREKNLEAIDSLDFAKELKILLKPLQIPLIVNDSLELCLKLDAEGLHLGQKDGDVIEARKALGPNKILGLTVDTLEQLKLANNLPMNCIDYVGIGAIFPSKTKPNTQIIGIHGLKQVVKLSKHPIVAIGGINEKNVSSIMQAGAHGIAAIGAFHDTVNSEMVTTNLRNIIEPFSLKYSCPSGESEIEIDNNLCTERKFDEFSTDLPSFSSKIIEFDVFSKNSPEELKYSQSVKFWKDKNTLTCEKEKRRALLCAKTLK